MYGFCGNDPINRFDVNGCSWLSKLWDHTILKIGQQAAINWDHSGRTVAEDLGAVVAGFLTAGAGLEIFAAIEGGTLSGGFLGALSDVGLASGWGGGWAAAAGAGFGFGTGFTGSLMHHASFGRALENGAIGAAIGGAIGYAQFEIGTGLQAALKGHLAWYQGTFDPQAYSYDVTSIEDSTTISGVQNIYVNGMQNSLEQALSNAEQKYFEQDFLLAYSSEHDVMADLVEAATGVAGDSSEATDLAQVLSQIDPQGSTLFLHSRGAIIGVDALQQLASAGTNLNGLTVSAYGGAENVLVAKAAVSAVGASWGGWVVNSFDLVPNLAGGNALLAPWRMLTSIVASPFVFNANPATSPHSIMTANGNTIWSAFNTTY